MPKAIDLMGHRFGRLVVTGKSARHVCRSGQTKTVWRCRCDCGTDSDVLAASLRSGETKSCGCLKAELLAQGQPTHGMWHDERYNLWMNMKGRCLCVTDAAWGRYGGRGIKVCDQWRDDFSAFCADMGPRPSPRHTIERVDNDGNYEPGNCRWATKKEQARNTRRNRLLTFQGETLCVAEFAERAGITTRTLHKRLKAGWSINRAVTTPSRRAA